MPEFRELTLTEAAHGMRAGKVSSEKLVRSCLERIAVRNEALKAWVEVNQEKSLAAAKQLDQEASEKKWRGPLHGITLGVKDIIDVAGLPTRAGTDAYPSSIASTDAEVVARMRQGGAIILGKTATCPFAFTDPAPTRNPWHPEHTPGGSSAGSAVAVADRHCQIALGTQTNGSIIRPASYNGVVGFKPGHSALPTDGIIPLSWQLDHLGLFARSTEDIWLFWESIRPPKPPQALLTDKLPRLESRIPQRIWRLDELSGPCDSDMQGLMEDFCRMLSAKDSLFVKRKLPSQMKNIPSLHHTLMAAEAATVHHFNRRNSAIPYPPNINNLIEEGSKLTAVEYLEATREKQNLQASFDSLMDRIEVAILPAAAGAAPKDLSSTGKSNAALPFSFLGLPSISLPLARNQDGLPLAIQLVAPRFQEEKLAGLCHGLRKSPPL